MLATIKKVNQHSRCIRKQSTKTFNEIPTPKGLPIIGTTLDLIKSGGAAKLHEYVNERHRTFGPIYKEKIGPVEAVFVSHPEDYRTIFSNEGKHPVHLLPEAWTLYNQTYGCSRGLFFMDGEEWLTNRKKMNQILLKGDLDWIDSSTDLVTDDFVHFLARQNGEIVHQLDVALYKLSLETLVAVLLGPKSYQNNHQELHVQLDALSKSVHFVFDATAKLQLIPAKLAKILRLKSWTNFVEAVSQALTSANALTDDLINIKSSEGLLSKMINAQIPQETIKRIVADLILAAGDTTAYSTQWSLYLLAKYPEVQQQLRSVSNPKQLLRNILKESLRLYPVAPFLTRISSYEITLQNYKIPPQTILILSIYTSGRNANIYPDPDLFLPQRWDRADVDSNKMQHLATLPFAIGARSCIGRKIAEGQLQSTLLKVVRNFEVELCNEKDVEMVLKMVSVPSEKVLLKFKSL